ncbi:hypothetical protein OKA04_10255 [Luteolibacter flavescens]|uniref:Uncharacterized protein n=1 Tax=Luteolibacter flavescens TaxID=1859460 RepID=A0ABT3FNG4_9BACT|nr:hypothetical protein [Luteolibacter flavescens]MCW1885110.1 hypothetical protein [Luteolibacter flavescens]
MTPDYERFAELATRPLESLPDLREEARAEVLSRLAHGGQEIPADVARLEAKRPSSTGRWAGVVAAVIVLLGAIAAWQGRHAVPELRILSGIFSTVKIFEYKDGVRESVAPENRDYVFAGFGSYSEAITNLERQWQLHPDDLGIYEELAHRRLAAEQGLPPGFSETWQRLDPDNGVWLFLEAMGKHEEWKSSGPPAGELYSKDALDLLLRSAVAPRHESHIPALHSRRYSMIPRSETVADNCALLLHAISTSFLPTMSNQRETLDSFNGGVQDAIARDDGERLAELILAWERLIGRKGVDASSVVEQSTATGSWNHTGKEMQDACRKLGLTDLEARLDGLQKKFSTHMAMYSGAMYRGLRRIEEMGVLARTLWSGSVLPVDPELHAPGRLAEYAVMERMLGLAAALIVLLFLLVMLIEGVRRGRRVNGLVDGLSPLFRLSDVAWMVGLGVVLPVVWYFGITRWTPLGLRDIGMPQYTPQPVLIQAAAGLVFVLLMIVQAARWRLVARAGFLALKPAWPWVGWTMTAVAALVIPLSGAVRYLPGNEERFLQGVAAAGGMALLWLVWEAGALVFKSRDTSLGGVLLARRMALPLASLPALLLACWGPLLATERHWHSLDQMTRGNPERGGLNFTECRLVDHMRESFRQAFPEASGTR